jgi:predicted DNA-binding transcriptional regulator YafY
VLTVLELLQSRQRISGPELAARLEVNIRTARRYITMLQDLGIPIEAERGRHGAYRLRAGFKLPPLMFTEDEALALTLGLLAARRMGLAVAAPAVEGALAKVERALPPALRERLKAVQETLALDVAPPSNASPVSSVVVTLGAAAASGRRAFLRYRAWSGDETEREIETYGLVYREGFWYAVGYCHLRCGLRVFRLDRVLQAELREATFERPAGFDSVGYVVRSIASMPNTWQVEVLLKTTLEKAQQVVPSTLATLEQTPEGVSMRCYVESLTWTARTLAGLGVPLLVRQPPELRDELRQLAAQIAEMAEERVAVGSGQ